MFVRLKEARVKKLLSAARLAKASGVSVATIHALEQGKWLPSLLTVKLLSETIGINPEDVDEFKAAMDKASKD